MCNETKSLLRPQVFLDHESTSVPLHLQVTTLLLSRTANTCRATHANSNVWPGPHMQTAMCGPRAKFLNPQKVFFCFLKRWGLKTLLEKWGLGEREGERWHN